MQGRRLDDVLRGDLPPAYQRGDYWREVDADGALVDWFCVAPSTLHAAPSRLSRHQVVEESDRTISVTPSIQVFYGDGAIWHGFLTRGEWREV